MDAVALGLAVAAKRGLALTNLRHRVMALGDSRVDAVTNDGTQRIFASTSPLNWASAILGGRLTILPDLGVSGNRTDQIAARLPAALASGAGTLYLQGGANNIAQDFPTAGTSGATAAANMIAMTRGALAAGMIVVMEAEIGGTGLTAAQVGQVMEMNAILHGFARATPGVYLHDARRILLNHAFAGPGTQFRSGLAYDNTHTSTRGSQRWGNSLAALFATIVPPRAAIGPTTPVDLPANGRRQLLLNPMLGIATGGTAGTGASGVIPQSWTASMSGGGTCVLAVGADAEGTGYQVTATIDFTAANQTFRLSQDVAGASYAVGDIVQGVADIAIPGTAAASAGPFLFVEHNDGAASFQSMALFPPDLAGQTGPEAQTGRLTLVTREYTLGAYSGGWLVGSIRLRALAAGQVVLHIFRVGIMRRVA